MRTSFYITRQIITPITGGGMTSTTALEAQAQLP
jgi:hypothetical protein